MTKAAVASWRAYLSLISQHALKDLCSHEAILRWRLESEVILESMSTMRCPYPPRDEAEQNSKRDRYGAPMVIQIGDFQIPRLPIT